MVVSVFYDSPIIEKASVEIKFQNCIVMCLGRVSAGTPDLLTDIFL